MIIQTENMLLNENNDEKPAQSPASDAKSELLNKEKRLYARLNINEKVRFGYDTPIYNGMSIDLSPDGMSLISTNSLMPESDIMIRIYASLIRDDNAEKIQVIKVEGKIVFQ